MSRNQPSADAPLFFVGVLSSVIGLIVLLFILVMIPYVFFNATSTVPDFVITLSGWLEEHNDLQGFWHRVVLIAPFLLASGLLFFISWHATVTLEKKDAELAKLHEKAVADERDEGRELKGTEEAKGFEERHPALLIFSLILLVIGGLVLIEYLIGADIL
ncbi:MAG: hypothetical protein HY939_01770 [Gammaproteobacteria bacterium]|nr:hypothetical protein [Gammaproteobacteria bacterium]